MMVDWKVHLPLVKGRYAHSALLSKHTWFGVGGPADVLYKPYDEEDLCYFLKNRSPSLSLTCLGAGSNVLIRDRGIPGVTIRLVGRAFSSVFVDQETGIVEAGAGALDRVVALTAAQEGIGGLAFLVGIPGTLGGAVRMNAGAYGQEIGDIFQECEAIDPGGKVHHLTSRDLGFTYRQSALPAGWIVTKVIVKGYKQSPQDCQTHLQAILEERAATQPIKGKTGGSTFKNPLPHKAWELIDQAGCRGLSHGGAQVSPKHCNFLLNTGTATASDLETLGERVRQRVQDKTGVQLEWEIIRLGQ